MACFSTLHSEKKIWPSLGSGPAPKPGAQKRTPSPDAAFFAGAAFLGAAFLFTFLGAAFLGAAFPAAFGAAFAFGGARAIITIWFDGEARWVITLGRMSTGSRNDAFAPSARQNVRS